ncbi:MAG: hypothetical protein HY391_02960 [Deltaproteobacteria bacterium]|nr:hypothetical protein [Deltaproteobacteria bacterium]
MNLEEVFLDFLADGMEKEWLSRYQWYHDTSHLQLRAQMRPSEIVPWKSRSHKKAAEDNCWGIEVKAWRGNAIGVDLEFYKMRPLLTSNRKWMAHWLDLDCNSSPMELLEEWAAREAAFKCVSPLLPEEELSMSDFVRTRGILELKKTERLYQIETCFSWNGPWILALARTPAFFYGGNHEKSSYHGYGGDFCHWERRAGVFQESL